MEVYLDNSATTKPYNEVIQKMREISENFYANPSSLHRKGLESEKLIKSAKESIAYSINANPGEIFFTSGGTESNNLAILGITGANKGKHIITTSIEHPSVLNVYYTLKQRGYSVDVLDVDRYGLIDLDYLKNIISPETVIVSIMHVNNEIGIVQDINSIGKIIKQKNPKTQFHIDAVQSYGKLPVNVNQNKADLITVSSHKIHGPKGVGALFVRGGLKISPIMWGGGQQNNLRPGTENTEGIVGFGLAAKRTTNNMNASTALMSHLKNRLRNGILQEISNVHINTPADFSAPHILNVSFGGIKSEVLLHALESEGIYVSSGSACSARKKDLSYVLRSIGLGREWIEGSIRFSLSIFTTAEEIDYTVMILKKLVNVLRIR